VKTPLLKDNRREHPTIKVKLKVTVDPGQKRGCSLDLQRSVNDCFLIILIFTQTVLNLKNEIYLQ
jgi:hypothetical protein